MNTEEKIKHFEKLQSLPLQEIWKGRTTDPSLGPQYYYQKVNFDPAHQAMSNKSVAILGYACDAGVARNQGRVGTRLAPNAVRSRLSKVAYHVEEVALYDYGNITCVSDDLEHCQSRFASEISKILKQGSLPVAIGGGHDIAFAHFEGIWSALSTDHKPNIGIINFDAHFDLRPTTNQANSGTPFYQILNNYNQNVKYLPIGIQASSNTKHLYKIANEFNVECIEEEECTDGNLSQILNRIDECFSGIDFIYITIDLDGFSAMYAPGVSAPSPFGLKPDFVVRCLEHIFKSQKVVACDLAECNPLYDIDNRTTTLAARLIDKIIKFY